MSLLDNVSEVESPPVFMQGQPISKKDQDRKDPHSEVEDPAGGKD